MLALVTCHIFPPSIWYGKKWIPGTWLPGWQLAVFQSPRLHECGPADAHGNAQPFCMDKCIFRKKRLFCNLATRWNNILQFVPSFPIYGWLTWWCVFFLWGQPLKIIHKNSAKKRSSPLDVIFDTCASASSSHLFLVGEAEHMWLYPFARTNAFSAKKHVFCNLGARWHKILEFVPSCPICGWLAWWCDFFPVGPTFEDHPQVFSQKRSSPLNFIFDTCASASWSHLFWLVKLNICGCTPFARTNDDKCIFRKKPPVLQFGRVDTNFLNSSHHVLSVDDWPGDATFFLWANLWSLSTSIQSKKGPAPWILFLTPAPRPLQVTFLVGEAEHVCLYPFAGQLYSRRFATATARTASLGSRS